MPCGVSDVNLPSFLQERLGFLNTDRWSDPDCCDRLAIFGRLDRESSHLTPLLCRGHGGEKTSIGTTMFEPLARTSTKLLRRGRPSEAASSKARAVLCSESLSSTVCMGSKISTGRHCPHGHPLGVSTIRAGASRVRLPNRPPNPRPNLNAIWACLGDSLMRSDSWPVFHVLASATNPRPEIRFEGLWDPRPLPKITLGEMRARPRGCGLTIA